MKATRLTTEADTLHIPQHSSQWCLTFICVHHDLCMRLTGIPPDENKVRAALRCRCPAHILTVLQRRLDCADGGVIATVGRGGSSAAAGPGGPPPGGVASPRPSWQVNATARFRSSVVSQLGYAFKSQEGWDCFVCSLPGCHPQQSGNRRPMPSLGLRLTPSVLQSGQSHRFGERLPACDAVKSDDMYCTAGHAQPCASSCTA